MSFHFTAVKILTIQRLMFMSLASPTHVGARALCTSFRMRVNVSLSDDNLMADVGSSLHTKTQTTEVNQ